MDDPTADYLKTNLRTVQDRVSSLRIQTNQYETMEHIPGGPTQFISTSLEELGKLEIRLDEIVSEVLRITDQRRQRSVLLYRSGTKALTQNEVFIEAEALETLGRWGIIIAPMEYTDDPQVIDQLAQGRTFEDILALFKQLADLFNRMDQEHAKVSFCA